MPERKKKSDILLGSLLPLYITFLVFLYFFIVKACTPFTSILFDTSDMDRFTYLFGSPVFLKNITIKNVIYSCYLFFTGSVFISYVWTSFTLFAGSVFFVYKISLLGKGNRLHALLAVFIFTSFPRMFLNVFAVNVHITEMLFVLMLIYFYIKGAFYGAKGYAAAYFIVGMMSFSVRSSILMYLAIIVLLTSYYQIKQKKYLYPVINFIIVVGMGFVSIVYPSQGYLYSKLGHWPLYFNNLDFSSGLNLIRLILFHLFIILKDALSLLYFMLFALCVGKRVYTSPHKQTLLMQFLEPAVLLILMMYALTVAPVDSSLFGGIVYGDTPLFDDIFPVNALFAILIAEYMASCFAFRKKVYFVLIVIIIGLGCFQGYANFIGFREHERAVLDNPVESYSQGRWLGIYNDIANTVAAREYDDFLFVIDKEDSNSRYRIRKEDARIVFVPVDIIVNGINNNMNYIFDYVYDIMLLQGYNNFRIASEKDRSLLKKYSFDGYTLCFIGKHSGFEFDNSLDINPVNSWTLQLEDTSYGLYLYGVLEKEISDYSE